MGKFYEVDFGEEDDNVKTISELFESIQIYRDRGKTLAKIHAAFSEAGLWQKSYSSFSGEYYQYRRQQKESTRDDETKEPRKKSRVKNRKVTAPTIDNAKDGSTDIDTQPASRIVIDPGMTLAEKRAFANREYERRQKEA